MKTFSYTIAWFYDLLFWPFQSLTPLVGMLFISALTGVLMLLVYKYTSNQRSIKATKQQIKGNFLAIALYKDSLKVLLSSTAKILRHNGKYMALNLVPLLFMILPVGLLLINIDAWYGHRTVRPGENIVLTAEVEPGADLSKTVIELEVPEGLIVETPPVRVPKLNQVSWRIGAEKPGEYQLRIKYKDSRIEKDLVVGKPLARLSPTRYKAGFWNKVLHPTEPIIASAAPVKELRFRYPGNELDVFGWEMHWIYAYFVFSILFALPMRGLFGVEI